MRMSHMKPFALNQNIVSIAKKETAPTQARMETFVVEPLANGDGGKRGSRGAGRHSAGDEALEAETATPGNAPRPQNSPMSGRVMPAIGSAQYFLSRQILHDLSVQSSASPQEDASPVAASLSPVDAASK